MPSSLQSNPLAFLRAAGGSISPPGPTAMGSPSGPAGMAPDEDSGGPGGVPPNGPLPPEVMNMMLAQAVAPQILAQQQTEYYKKFLDQLAGLLREFMRQRGLGPKVVSTVGRSVVGLKSAISLMDKEKPEDAAPVGSLLAGSIMGGNRPLMANNGPMQRLPVMR